MKPNDTDKDMWHRPQKDNKELEQDTQTTQNAVGMQDISHQ